MTNSNIAIGLLEEYFGLEVSKLETIMKKWLDLASEIPGYDYNKIIDDAYRWTLNVDKDINTLVDVMDCGFAETVAVLIRNYLTQKYPDLEINIEVRGNQIICNSFPPFNFRSDVIEAERELCKQTGPIRNLIETCKKLEKEDSVPGATASALETAIEKNNRLDRYTIDEIRIQLSQAFADIYDKANMERGSSRRFPVDKETKDTSKRVCKRAHIKNPEANLKD